MLEDKPPKRSKMKMVGDSSEGSVAREAHLNLKEKTPEFTKMSEIHELFVLTLSLVWFAAATPACCWWALQSETSQELTFRNQEKGVLAKGVFCRVQCHAQGNRKFVKDIGPCSAFRTQSAAGKGGVTFLQKKNSENPLFFVPDTSRENLHIIVGAEKDYIHQKKTGGDFTFIGNPLTIYRGL